MRLMTVSKFSALFAFALLLSSVLTGCGGRTPLDADPATMEKPTYEAGPDDRIRTGDTLIVRISGVPSQDQGVYEAKVNEAGEISMPYIGNLQATGLTAAELKNKIETTYREKKIFTNPSVIVNTSEVRFVTVSGEVRAPGRVQYTKDLTVVGAIADRSGFTDYANRKKVRLLRKGKIIEFNAFDIIDGRTPDIPMQPGDVISVERSIF
jgi:protein involved in polysaccharide export with SLBB domain